MTTEPGIDALLEAALDQMLLTIAGTRPDQLALPTPCADWNVRALLNHIVGGPAVFVSILSGTRGDWNAPQPDVLGNDPAAAFRSARHTLEGAFRHHPAKAGAAKSYILGETAIHAWDLAEATGQTGRLDPAIAETALVLLRERLTPEARASSTAFGPEIPVAGDAPPYERLAGFLGRQPAA